MLLESRKERYLRSPTLLRRDGAVVLSLRVWEGSREQLVEYRLCEEGTLLEGDKDAVEDGVVGALTSCDVEEDREACSDVGRVWIERRGSHSTLWYSPKSEEQGGAAPIKIWAAHATVAAPYMQVCEEGTWVAFHHNLREDNQTVDVAKWIALRFVDRFGEVWEVDAPWTDRNRDQEGEEQSFEFPVLLCAPNGALCLVGRGSHQYWRQDISANGFSKRTPVGDGGWGCRGRRVSLLACDGHLLAAWRERKGIVVEALPMPSGGAPKLKRAVLEEPTKAPRIVRRPEVDPAAQWNRQTLFGDIHQHSAHSDGIGSADEPYLRARYQYGDDFCALSDHESFLGKRIGPAEWEYLQSVADSHNEPGAFATLLAYEWTAKMHPGPGHKVCYFKERTDAVISRDDVPEGKALVDAVKAKGGFSVPHHVGWTGANEEAHDEETQPVWEICSCHGCYEHWAHELGQRGELRDQMVDAVLARGHRFGFIASSDGHGLLWHHGVARKRDPFRTGLTAVHAEARTREAIMSAIAERRCYATSGVKIMLGFSVNGVPMGGEVSSLESPSISLYVEGRTSLLSVELVDVSGVIKRWEPEGTLFEQEITLSATKYLYLRIRQQDGEMAWSSPVFVEPQ